MCGVFGQVQLNFNNSTPSDDVAPALFESPVKKNIVAPNHNIWAGMLAGVVISQDKERDRYQPAVFGFTPFWAKKKFYLINARAEGKDNPENDPAYRGKPGIFSMTSFKHAIRNKRCVIPVDYFIEGTETNKLEEPFLIRQKNGEPFFLGGIWDDWSNAATGEFLRSFAIVTTAATPLMQQIPHHRSPVIIPTEYVGEWLNYQTDWNLIREHLRPAKTDGFEAFPISPLVKTKKNDPSIFEPLGDIIE